MSLIAEAIVGSDDQVYEATKSHETRTVIDVQAVEHLTKPKVIRAKVRKSTTQSRKPRRR